MQVHAEDNTVYVYGLPRGVTSGELRRFFERRIDCRRGIKTIRVPKGGKGLKELYVTRSLEKCDGADLRPDVKISVKKCLPKNKVTETITLEKNWTLIRRWIEDSTISIRLTVNSLRCSLLHYATLDEELDIMSFLLHRGLNKDINDCNKRTPLHYSCMYGKYESLKFLLSQGARVNVFDYLGNTPLHYCAMNGYVEFVSMIVRKSANLRINYPIQNHDGKTAWALWCEKMKKLRILGPDRRDDDDSDDIEVVSVPGADGSEEPPLAEDGLRRRGSREWRTGAGSPPRGRGFGKRRGRKSFGGDASGGRKRGSLGTPPSSVVAEEAALARAYKSKSVNATYLPKADSEALFSNYEKRLVGTRRVSMIKSERASVFPFAVDPRNGKVVVLLMRKVSSAQEKHPVLHRRLRIRCCLGDSDSDCEEEGEGTAPAASSSSSRSPSDDTVGVDIVLLYYVKTTQYSLKIIIDRPAEELVKTGHSESRLRSRKRVRRGEDPDADADADSDSDSDDSQSHSSVFYSKALPEKIWGFMFDQKRRRKLRHPWPETRSSPPQSSSPGSRRRGRSEPLRNVWKERMQRRRGGDSGSPPSPVSRKKRRTSDGLSLVKKESQGSLPSDALLSHGLELRRREDGELVLNVKPLSFEIHLSQEISWTEITGNYDPDLDHNDIRETSCRAVLETTGNTMFPSLDACLKGVIQDDYRCHVRNVVVYAKVANPMFLMPVPHATERVLRDQSIDDDILEFRWWRLDDLLEMAQEPDMKVSVRREFHQVVHKLTRMQRDLLSMKNSLLLPHPKALLGAFMFFPLEDLCRIRRACRLMRRVSRAIPIDFDDARHPHALLESFSVSSLSLSCRPLFFSIVGSLPSWGGVHDLEISFAMEDEDAARLARCLRAPPGPEKDKKVRPRQLQRLPLERIGIRDCSRLSSLSFLEDVLNCCPELTEVHVGRCSAPASLLRLFKRRSRLEELVVEDLEEKKKKKKKSGSGEWAECLARIRTPFLHLIDNRLNSLPSRTLLKALNRNSSIEQLYFTVSSARDLQRLIRVNSWYQSKSTTLIGGHEAGEEAVVETETESEGEEARSVPEPKPKAEVKPESASETETETEGEGESESEGDADAVEIGKVRASEERGSESADATDDASQGDVQPASAASGRDVDPVPPFVHTPPRPLPKPESGLSLTVIILMVAVAVLTVIVGVLLLR